VTGRSRPLQPREVNLVKLVIASLPDCTELTTGAAHGVDTEAYLWGVQFQKQAKHRVVIPRAPFNDAVAVEAARRSDIVEYAPAGLTNADAYMNRNERMVLYADKLIAFPETATEEMRSGTWATIRRARRAGLDVDLHPLDGKSGGRQARRRFKHRT
jgi:hypothetical protein